MNRNEALDRLALGVNCPRCRVTTDEPCITRRSGRQTAPHQDRIDRACRGWEAMAALKARREMGQ